MENTGGKTQDREKRINKAMNYWQKQINKKNKTQIKSKEREKKTKSLWKMGGKLNIKMVA